MIVVVRLHPHRVNFGPNDLPKSYVHVSSWGPEPRAFHELEVNIPTRGVYDARGCGCASHVAQYWMEGEVEETEIVWSADFRRVTVGKAPATKTRTTPRR